MAKAAPRQQKTPRNVAGDVTPSRVRTSQGTATKLKGIKNNATENIGGVLPLKKGKKASSAGG